ncbi:DUF305 domain-containing protein [Saccharomonospora cyanea]|uniref:DUF305 domain-containing protein n=1 Tax=Saccharomonospora cyanea NA-134 TaxID=882082 RepID=H5XHZ8_9PSEU|nr:DUF305 domain-containing protein [Saccharomonospora cyanea]EHR59604.1 hypothetical protein SaccyDRAFT_0680 [Saccharomonospora cyanea NA-134]
MKKSLVRAALVAAMAAAVAAGCAGGDSGGDGTDTAGDTGSRPGPSTSAQQQAHNEADVAFVRQMIPHHVGAIEMAELAEGRTDNPRILDLADRIEQAQGPEIEQMRNQLHAWGVGEMPGMAPEDMDHGDMGHGEMPGMGAEDMRKLEQANGTEFDRLFLELMIEHHQGAVDMSHTVLDKGSDPEVKDLARRIIDTQEAEITEMRSLLES